jgi:hypothetical protein
VLRQGFQPVVSGLMVGVVVVIATGKWIESFLLGIRAVNPLAI